MYKAQIGVFHCGLFYSGKYCMDMTLFSLIGGRKLFGECTALIIRFTSKPSKQLSA
jgi:hypothetical protein